MVLLTAIFPSNKQEIRENKTPITAPACRQAGKQPQTVAVTPQA
jgi:hypothetical protein